MMNKPNKENFTDFDALKLTLASPDDILDWSFGEVTKAETINYRTFRPEPDGLFCEKIFGPSKNYECYCGKYKKVRYRGIVCDKCGVEVTTKDVRRERMGHIKLAVPVAHVWFAYGIPNKLQMVLNMGNKKILSVVYYTRYMVVSLEDDKRDQVIKKAEELRDTDLADLKQHLQEALDAEGAAFDEQVKSLKKDKDKKAAEFKSSQIGHKKNQALAKVRKEFAAQEEVIDAFWARILQLIEKMEVGSILSEDEFIDLSDRDLLFFDARMGAEAIETLLKNFDLQAEADKLSKKAKREKGDTKANTIRRLQYIQGFIKNGIKPEWMIMKVLPVIPPELRPIIPLSGGKFATSDLNDLYRRIINRNNRLKRLIEIGAPEVILRNEKRMLQESVDALIDNSHRPAKPMMNNKKLPYQSLTDELRGKKGIFRRNLLGKRVDYSGRAVIIGDATLNLNQCGLPKSIAMEIFKPFVINKLLELEHAPNIRVAKDIIDDNEDIIWDLLEQIIQDKPVLLNRAPTLHKYSIQAFYPRLVEGEAIRVHPLVCKAYNADFDGDQMSVHVLLTDEAIEEGKRKMLAQENIINMKDGKLLANPAKDMLLGFFLLTDLDPSKKPKIFGSTEDVVKAYERGNITAAEEIIVKAKGQKVNTSAGRVIFNNILPVDYQFVNDRIDSGKVRKIVEEIKDIYPVEVVVKLLDDLKDIGFKYATDLGFTFAMEDCDIDMDLGSAIKDIEQKDLQLQENYLQGLSTEKEKVNQSIEMWQNFAEKSSDEAWSKLHKNNAIYEMVESGANGERIQARQILVLKGVVRDSRGNWVPLPIKGNFRDGLNAFEYFVSANSGRKGIADKTLRTSSSGYLTRKLVDVAHEVIIRQEDCGYEGEGLRIAKSDDRRMSFEERLIGRVVASAVKDGKETLVEKNEIITKEAAKKILAAGIEEVFVRTPILCKTPIGICQKCYGYNVEKGHMAEMGLAVGVIAAQSTGEPSTQMTMQTFHKGGVQKTDITQGLPRIEELFEVRTPNAEAEMATIDGKVSVEFAEDESATILIKGEKHMERFYVVSDAKKVSISDGSKVKAGQVMFVDFEGNEKQALFSGEASLAGGILKLVGRKKAEEVINVLPAVTVLVKDGDEVLAGQPLTEGSLDPKKIFKSVGLFAAQKYVLDNVQKVFNEQGVSISDVHLEVIIRQMARLGVVMNSGDSSYLVGSPVNRFVAEVKNDMLEKDGRNRALVLPKLMGIKASSLQTESFLSAMSFEQQVRVLTNAAIVGQVDYLRGMKENVIIGRTIPVGQEAQVEDAAQLEELKN